MSERWKTIFAIAGGLAILGAIVIAIWFNEPEQSRERVKLAVEKTEAAQVATKTVKDVKETAKKVLSKADKIFAVLLNKRCVLDSDTGEVFGYAHPDDEKVICLVHDGEVQAMVIPKDKRKP